MFWRLCKTTSDYATGTCPCRERVTIMVSEKLKNPKAKQKEKKYQYDTEIATSIKKIKANTEDSGNMRRYIKANTLSNWFT